MYIIWILSFLCHWFETKGIYSIRCFAQFLEAGEAHKAGTA